MKASLLKGTQASGRTLLSASILSLSMVLAACGGGTAEAPEPLEDDPPADTEDDHAADTDTAVGDDAAGDSGIEPRTVRIMANWLPQASQGGYWQAAAAGHGSEEGVTIEMVSGGPGVQTVTNVAIGDAEYGMTAADNIYLARAEGIPLVGIFAPLDNSPQCFVSHPEAEVETFTDFNDMNIAVSPAGSFWTIIKNKYDLEPAQEMPPQSFGTWHEDPNMIQQCFRGEDDYILADNGWEGSFLMVSESGYNPYTQVLFTTEKQIAENPEEVAIVVDAVRQGWTEFLNGDEQAGVDLILAENPDYTADAAAYTIDALAELVSVDLGSMDPQRWEETYQALRENDVISVDIDWEDAFTTEYLAAR